MGCGCHGRMIQESSTNEFFKKICSIAKQMAVEENTWYVVVQKDDGSYSYVPEESIGESGSVKIKMRLSPMP